MIKSISSDNYRSLVVWLKNCRIDKGLSMRDLGELIGEPHSFVQKIENHERRLDVYEYVQYCLALDVDPKKGLAFLSK